MAPARAGTRVDCTRGSIVNSLIRLAWPMMTSNMAVVLYQVANTFWLGSVGANAVASVAMAFPLLGFLWAVGDGIIMGGSALVAKYAGSGDMRSVNKVAAHVVVLIFAYYVVVALLVLPFLHEVLLLMGAPPEILGDVFSFVRILVLAMPLTEIFFVYSSMLQGTGDSINPMKMWSVTLMLNMVLDPILIVGVGTIGGYGLTGSAIAIVSCRLLLASTALVGFWRGYHGLQITRRDLKFDPALLRRLLRVSLPISGERLSLGMEQMVLVAIVAGFGTPVLAAYGVGQRVLSLATMPGFAAGTAVTALVGQNLGAGESARAEQGTWVSAAVAGVVLSIVGLVLATAAEPILSLFNREAAVLQHGIQFLKIVGPTVGLAAVFITLGGAYRALERTVPYMGWVLATSWFLKIHLALILPLTLGVSGIWIAMALTNVAAPIGAALSLKFGLWKKLSSQLLHS